MIIIDIKKMRDPKKAQVKNQRVAVDVYTRTRTQKIQLA